MLLRNLLPNPRKITGHGLSADHSLGRGVHSLFCLASSQIDFQDASVDLPQDVPDRENSP